MTIVLGLVVPAVALAAIMAIAWTVVLRTGKSGWTDTFWSGGIGLAGVAAALLPLGPGEPSGRALIVAALVALWSFRLAVHIGRRTVRGGDDPRYAKLREEWGDRYRSQLFLFLQIQAAAALVLVLCIFVAARNPAPLGLFDALGSSALGQSSGKASATANCVNSPPIPPTGARSATPASGRCRGTPTTSSSGSTGSDMCR